MLSMISLIYDPLGFAGPFILDGRRIYKNFAIKTYSETIKATTL